MPDAFFQKKRKRTNTSSSSSRAGPSRTTTTATTKSTITSNSQSRMRKGRNASPSSSDNDDDAVPGGGIDEMDLSHNYNQAHNSDDEAQAAETPAEARVRLAKMYLQGLSSSSSAPVEQGGDRDDFFESDQRPSFGLADAAVADRENIAARLQNDVAQQSGRLHLFLSDRIAPPLSTTTSSEQENVKEVQRGVDYTASILALGGGHSQSVTCAVASQDAKWLFTASKDGSIIRWRLPDGKLIRILPRRSTHLAQDGSALPPTSSGKSKTSGAARRRARLSKPSASSSSSTSIYLPVGAEQGHTDQLYTLSLSSDGTHLASGGADKRVCIWSVSQPCSETFLKTLSGHKDSISSLCFRLGSQQLYTASLDRTIKLFDISQLSYIETLFGHQESILSLSCLSSETAISAGGRDRTCRYWKIRDESQLVFRAGIKSKLRDLIEGGDLSSNPKPQNKGAMSNPTETQEGSVEVVAMIDSHHFLSGGDSGTISLWNLARKKPIFSFPVAHGFDVINSESEGEIRSPRWITSLAALPYADLFVSGSWDGTIRLWALDTAAGQVKAFRFLFDLPAQGVVNSLQIIQPLKSSPPIIIAAIGQEHKFGRWIKIKSAKNISLIIPLLLKPTTSNSNHKDV